jgi:ATP-dependent Clp protease adaptor protein ClpS
MPDSAGQQGRSPVNQQARPAARSQPLRVWNVVLIDDDDHTYDYVIEMLMNLCGHSLERGLRCARTIDREGRAIVFTGHRELAELKLEQIHTFGFDPRLAGSIGGMRAILEPAD